MANENRNGQNLLEFEGYLKENTLRKMVTKTGKDAISGVLTIALNEKEDYRVRFMVCQYSHNGSPNRSYSALEALLPENTITVATLLKNNPTAKFIEVKEQASKVWARGQFECYDRKDSKGNIHTTATVRGITAGFKNISLVSPFTLKARFDIEAYVDSIKDEKDKNGEETGRVVVGLIIPDFYNETIMPFDFICASDSAKTSIGHYQKGDSGRFVGTVKNTREDVAVIGEKTEFLDGSVEDSSRTTSVFVNERLIEKMTAPFEPGDVKCITAETIKQYAVHRQAKLDDMDITPDRNTVIGNGGSASAPRVAVKGFEL